MKKLISAIIVLSLTLSLTPAFADADNSETANNAVSGYVSASEGDIEIASKTKTPSIFVDADDYAGVIRAAGDLQSDIKAVTDVTANITDNADMADIVIGTIGKSSVIDSLIAENKIDVSEIENQWEAFTLQNIDGTLVIAGADKRGTIYGIYDLSEKMGVSPWEWWADVEPTHSDAVYVTLPENGYTEGASSVKYRGVFLNQEYNLWNWAKSLDGEIGIDTETYKKVFELLLRLKANYMWPAMHEYTQAFNVNPENARIADEYGIVMGTSHCEMLLRNNMGELLEFQERWIEENPDKNLYMFKDGSLNADVAYDYTDVDKDGNSVDNKEFVEDYWRERVRANKDYESNFTIGMRGVHDGAWNPVNAKTDAEKIALLEEIIAKQREILSEEIGKPAEEIPQTFIPYKEILPLYNAGLNVPDDVTIMWTNDNYGHIRQSSNAAERERSGGGGMYYHVSYYGRPSSVIWNGGTQLGLIKEEMTKAYDSGADTVWVLNVGPLKGFENQTEYFLDLGRNIDNVRSASVKDYVKDNAKRYFNFDDAKAEEYADIQCEFLELANSRRPDFMTQGVYSLTSYGDEGQIVLDKYDSLLKRSEALYNSLPADKQPSFYELQLYALKSADNVAHTFVNADKAALYKSQGRGACVNKYAENSKSAWAKITDDMNEYNTMLGGKWNNVVNPFQKKESGSWDIMRNWKNDNSTAVLETVDTLPYTEMGIAVENQQDINTSPALEFSGYTKDIRFIDIFNRGTHSFDWEITSNADWVIFNKTNGTVYDDDRIYAGIDWDKVPSGNSAAKITVTRYIGDNAVQSKTIDVRVNNAIKNLPEKTYAEANGYVSIEAEHFTASIENGSYKWLIQDDFGRSGTSMKFMPDTADSITDNSAYLEYDVNFESTGTFNVDIYRMPTLNERGSVNFALGIDGTTPTLLKGNNAYYNNSSGTDKWGKSILNNVEVLTSTVSVAEKGIHKIRLYGVDAGAVIDKIVITTGEKYESFYGAPESYNTTFNNQPMEMPEAKTTSTEITGSITELFSPKLHTVGINLDNSAFGVVTGNEPKLITPKNNGTAIIAVYKNNGTLSKIQSSDTYENGAYVFSNAVTLEDGETVKGMVWSSLSEMKPLTHSYGEAGESESTSVTGIDVIKLSNIANVLVTVAAYDTDGVMLSENTITHDFSSAKTNEKVNVPINFDIPEQATELQAIIYDSTENLNALSPSYTINTDTISLMASYDSGVIQIKSSLDNWGGREAICRISDTATDETVYIRQETVKDNTFKSIKTGNLNGTYDINIGVADNGTVIKEKAYTAQNITPDNAEASADLYNWDFSSDVTASSGNNVPVISGNAIYDSSNQAIKMTSTDKSGGNLSITFDEAVKTAQGQKITVVSKIAYGRQSGKYMDYMITDSNGKELIKSHISMYSSSSAQSLQIGDVEQLENSIPTGIAETKIKNNDGIKNGYSIFTATLDPNTNTITLVVSNAEGESTFTGKFPEGSSCDLGALNFSTTHTYASRSCYVDDIYITKTTEPSYTISFDVQNMTGDKIENASVKLTDGKFQTAINAENDGTYHLCDGVYSYTVTADGYTSVNGELELSQATESKTISVKMEKSGSENPDPTASPEPTDEPMPTPTASPEPTDEPTPTPTASPEPTDEPTPTPTAEPIEYDNTAGHWKFDFGADTENGYIGVNSSTSFSDELTYGFIGIKEEDYKLTSGEYMDGFRMVQGQKITLADGNGTADAPNNDFVVVTDKQYPIRFAMSVENGGYYNVKVTLANASQTEPATVSLFTERRHQLLTNAEIPAGGTLEYEFNVDIETYYWKALNGQYKDDTLSVEVAGENAAIASMEVTKTEGKTIWILSDSTGCDQPTNFPYFNLASLAGVGQGLTKYLPANIAISNQGDGGIASNDTNHFNTAKAGFKEGDYLYVEYGHNETGVDSYKSNLQKYYDACKAAKMKMIVVGPIDRVQSKQFDKQTGKWSSTLSGYSEAGKAFVDEQLASGATDIAFVDINAGWIEFLNNTSSKVKEIRQSDTYEDNSVYYYYRYKSSGIDTTHINEAGADNAAYIFFTEAKKIVEANGDAQSAVLADLVNGMREHTPYTVSEEIVKAGTVPNSYYPSPVYEEYDGYEAAIKKASIDGEQLQNVTAKIEHYTGLERKDIPYAVAIAEIYGADGNLTQTYQSTTSTKYDTTNGNGTFTLVFDNAVIPDGGTYKIWIQGFSSDNQVMNGEDNRISDYYTPDSASDIYLIGDKEDIEIPDTFAYYGIKNGSDLAGNNDWYLVGSSTKSATLEKETLDGQITGYAKLSKGSTSGSYVLYRAFDSAVNASKVILDTDLYYEDGYMRFTLSNKTSSPNNGYSQSINCFTINKGKLLDSNGTEIGNFPANEWTHITYVLDMDYGTQTLTVGETEYEYNADGMASIIAGEVSPSAVQQLNISGSSSAVMSARITNTAVKNTVQSELPEKTLTITEPDSAEGTVSVTDSEGLTKTATMNSIVTVSAIPVDGYTFVGWYENDNLVSGTALAQIRLHRDVTLTAKFEADNDPITYAYNQTCTALSTDTLAENGYVSKNAQSSLTVTTDEEYGNYIYFNPGSNTRNVKATFPEAAQLTEKYVLEMDLGITSGNSAMSEFTILSADTSVPDNASVTGNYLLKFTSTAKSASNTKSMVWNVNDNAEDTITFTQSGTSPTWAHLKMIVDPQTNEAEVIVTEGDNEIYSKTLSISGDTAVVGFNFKAGKSYGRGKFDNIKIYTASQITQ